MGWNLAGLRALGQQVNPVIVTSRRRHKERVQLCTQPAAAADQAHKGRALSCEVRSRGGQRGGASVAPRGRAASSLLRDGPRGLGNDTEAQARALGDWRKHRFMCFVVKPQNSSALEIPLPSEAAVTFTGQTQACDHEASGSTAPTAEMDVTGHVAARRRWLCHRPTGRCPHVRRACRWAARIHRRTRN